jgi:hypothetical protein
MSRNTGYDPAYDDYTSEEYPPDWDGRRKEVLARDGYTCRGCGVTSTRVDDVYFDVDHVVPKSAGGGHELTNLQTLCPSCHAGKHPDNGDLARRARKWERRNTRSLVVRLLRIVLVIPVLFSLLSGSSGSSRTITDEHGREFELTEVESVPDLPADRGVTVDARVATLWDATAESVQQVGLLAPADSTREDDVTLVKFVVWTGNGLPEMRANESYRFVGALTDEYDGDAQLVLDGQSEIRPLT